MDYRIYDVEDETTDSEESYKENNKRKQRWMLLILSSIILIAFISLYIGNKTFDAFEITRAIFTGETSTTIGGFIWKIDIPIAIAAILSGAMLSIAGTAMQCVLRNPLASPYTLGISNAAAFGAAFSIIFLTGNMNAYSTPISAFVMAMVATGLIILLTKVTRVSSETMVLAGIAISAIFSAGMTLMQYIADPIQLSSIVTWTFGSVSHTNWKWDFVLLVVMLVAVLYFYPRRWDMNAMNAGDEVAKGLGVDTKRFLTVGMFMSAVITAFVVSKFGVISFVGLLGPHMARTIVGDDHRFLLPMSMLTGALLLLVANIIALNVALPRILPVGLLTSLIGGPTFIYMLIRRYRAS